MGSICRKKSLRSVVYHVEATLLPMHSSHKITCLTFAALIVVGLLSCRGNRSDWDGELFTTVDHMFVESEFASIVNLIDYQARSDSTLLGAIPTTLGFYCAGAGLTVSNVSSGRATLTMDFASGTNCLDGRTRSGILIADFNGEWKNPGSVVTIRPNSYSVEGFAFAFNLTMTMNVRNDAGQLNWTSVVPDAELINPAAGSRINWESTRTTTWVEGETTPDLSDNLYELTSVSSGTARNTLSFSAATVTPLQVEIDCPTPTAGTLTISPFGLETRTIDLGEGACDNVAVLRIDNFETQVNLR